MREYVTSTLTEAGISHEVHSTGVSVAGGSVNHHWCRVTLDGSPTDGRVLVGPSRNNAPELEALAGMLGVAVERLDIEIPEDMPPNT